jgi:hypothetical protein
MLKRSNLFFAVFTVLLLSPCLVESKTVDTNEPATDERTAKFNEILKLSKPVKSKINVDEKNAKDLLNALRPHENVPLTDREMTTGEFYYYIEGIKFAEWSLKKYKEESSGIKDLFKIKELKAKYNPDVRKEELNTFWGLLEKTTWTLSVGVSLGDYVDGGFEIKENISGFESSTKSDISYRDGAYWHKRASEIGAHTIKFGNSIIYDTTLPVSENNAIKILKNIGDERVVPITILFTVKKYEIEHGRMAWDNTVKLYLTANAIDARMDVPEKIYVYPKRILRIRK